MRLFPITKAGMFKLASMLVVFGFIFPFTAEATVYKPADISFTLDSLVNGQKTNFVRLGADGKDVIIDLNITLNTPPKLLVGRSISDTQPDDLDFGGSTISNKRILGLGAGYIPQQKSEKYFCDKKAFTGLINLDNTNYTGCVFYKYSSDVAGWRPVVGTTEYTAGQVALKGSFPINAATLQDLGATPDSGKTIAISFYPYVYTSSLDQGELAKVVLAGGTDLVKAVSTTWGFIGGAQIVADAPQVIYFQLYKTQAAADADASKPAPSEVPPYSSTQSQVTGGTNEGGMIGLLNKILAAILTLILQILYSIFWFIIVPLLEAVLSIRTFKDSFVNIIYPGWEIIRNLCNIGFVIAMLWMGLSQVFGFDSFNYKKGLGKLVIAALLVNFSLIIPQTILAVSETVQNQFLPNNTKVINALGYKLMVEPMQTLQIGSSTIDSLSVGSVRTFGTTAKIFLYFCMAVAAFFVFAALLLNLLVRLVALWALFLTSPIGFAGGVLPFTAKFQSQWWKLFICYVTYTPVVAFMLNLTALMTDRINQGLNSTVIPNFTGTVSQGISSFVFTLLPNFLLLGFMYATISVAKMACGFAPVDKLTSKFGGRALDLASTSMTGRPDKALRSAADDIGLNKLREGVGSARDVLSRNLANRKWHEGGDKVGDKIRKSAFMALNSDRVAKRAWSKYWTEPKEEKEKKQKEAIEGVFKTYKKADKFANDAKAEAKDSYSGFVADDIDTFNKLKGKTDIKSKLKRAGMLLHAMDDPKNADAFLKGIGYSTNAEGVLKMLNKEVSDNNLTSDQAKEMQKRFDRSFRNKKMYSKLGLRDEKTGAYRTLADLATIKQDQIEYFQRVSNNKNQAHLKNAGTPIFTEFNSAGVLGLNDVGAAHIAHSRDPNRKFDIKNAPKLRPDDIKLLEEINNNPVSRQAAIDRVLASNFPIGPVEAERRWNEYYLAANPGGSIPIPPAPAPTPVAPGGRAGATPSPAGPRGAPGGGGGRPPSAAGPGFVPPTSPPATGTPPPVVAPTPVVPGAIAGTPPTSVAPTATTGGGSGSSSSASGPAVVPPSTIPATPTTGVATPTSAIPTPSIGTPTPPATSSSPTSGTVTPTTTSTPSVKKKLTVGGNPVTDLQNPQPVVPPTPSHVAPPDDDVVRNYIGLDAIKDNISMLSSSGMGSDPVLSGIGQKEKEILAQGISAEMNTYHGPLSQSSGQNFVAMLDALHKSLAKQIITARGLNPKDPKDQAKALESAKNITRSYMKGVYNL